MINLSFHWSWILAAAIVLIGIIIGGWLIKEADGMFGAVFVWAGCLIFIIFVLIALVILGIFVW